MSGYGSRDKPSQGKLTDLWAKALILEDSQGTRGVVITLDLVGIDRALSMEICKQISMRHGIDRKGIAICTSHTHTGPAVGRNLGAMLDWRLNDAQRKQIADYSDQLVQDVVQAVGKALEDREPIALSWGSGSATFAVNRRTNRENEVPSARTSESLQGPVDHDVPVLALRDAKGSLKGVLFGYACHATVLGTYEWSGDYPAFAQMELEALHPECIALFWAGCGADQNPLPRKTVAHAKHYGRRLADAVESVLLTSQMQEVQGKLQLSYREIDLPFAAMPSREDWVKDASSKDPYVASRAKLLLAQIDSGKPLDATYPYPIGCWKIGDLQWITLGGEVVVDYAKRLKIELSGKSTWVAGYSHDVMAYIPSRRVLTEGGYEGGGAMVYYGLPTVWGPEVEERIVREVHRQAKGEVQVQP